MVQVVKNLPAMQETWVRSLDLEDPPWRRTWQSTLVFSPEEFFTQTSLVAIVHRVAEEWDFLEELTLFGGTNTSTNHFGQGSTRTRL